MIKLKFEEINYRVKSKNEYEDIGELPVNIILDTPLNDPQFNTYYITGNEFFIEFRFTKEGNLFNQIGFVCLGSAEIRYECTIREDVKLFECKLDSKLVKGEEIEFDLTLDKIGNVLIFVLYKTEHIREYYVSDKLAFRVDQDNYLCGMIVIDEKELIESLMA